MDMGNVKNRKFLVTSGIILLATVLLCWQIILPGDWVSTVKVIGGAYLTANVANRALDYHYGRKEFDYLEPNIEDNQSRLEGNGP